MSIFTGVATLTTTNTHAPGPFSQSITLPIFFTNGLSQVILGPLPTITGPAPGSPPISTPVGNDTFTLTLESGVSGNGTGTFTPSGSSAGKMVVSLALHLHNSVLFGTEDSNIPFTGAQTLTTETSTSADGKISLTGSRFNPATGAITLVGATLVAGGFLGGSDAGLTITGTLTQPVDTPVFGALTADHLWTGNFTGSSKTELLLYIPANNQWWLGTFFQSSLNWALVDNTQGFGNISSDEFWIGNFSDGSSTHILFYSIVDSNWWLGTVSSSGAQLAWIKAGNTQGFGNISKDEFWVGNFSGGNNTQILFYSISDSNWWLGTFSGSQLSWTKAGNTQGFGNISKDEFWVGNFNGGNNTQILFYSISDSNWWLGTFSGSQLSWTKADNTQGFGNISSDEFWVGNFSGAGKTQILFYSISDSNWWLGTFSANQLSWVKAGNTQGFGNISKDEFWIGAFNGGNDTQILFYSIGDSNWWLGTFSGSQLSWTKAGNTQGFGNISKYQFWTGAFSGGSNTQILFYSAADGNWWLGTISANQLTWALAVNTHT